MGKKPNKSPIPYIVTHVTHDPENGHLKMLAEDGTGLDFDAGNQVVVTRPDGRACTLNNEDAPRQQRENLSTLKNVGLSTLLAAYKEPLKELGRAVISKLAEKPLIAATDLADQLKNVQNSHATVSVDQKVFEVLCPSTPPAPKGTKGTAPGR
mgnify:CR=1 FL=1